MTSAEPNNSLTVALTVAAIALFAAVVPMWPYGYYVLLRLVATAVAIYALVAGSTLGPGHRVALAVIALLFNPLFPVYLTRAIWFPIDIGIGIYFLVLRSMIAGASADSTPQEGKHQPPVP